MKAWAIIAAGGTGTRMGSDVPKQLLTLQGKTILEMSIEPFLACEHIEKVIVVSHSSILDRVREFPFSDRLVPVAGGPERQDSVFRGLQAVPEDVEIVVVHDGVRPFIDKELICSCIDKAVEHGAVTVMRPLKETVKVVEGDFVVSTPERGKLWLTLTPQAFRREVILRAHALARQQGFTGTDDAMLVERMGHKVKIIEGKDINIKITTRTDLISARAIMSLLEGGELKC